jgi:hypothetical protein
VRSVNELKRDIGVVLGLGALASLMLHVGLGPQTQRRNYAKEQRVPIRSSERSPLSSKRELLS